MRRSGNRRSVGVDGDDQSVGSTGSQTRKTRSAFPQTLASGLRLQRPPADLPLTSATRARKRGLRARRVECVPELTYVLGGETIERRLAEGLLTSTIKIEEPSQNYQAKHRANSVLLRHTVSSPRGWQPCSPSLAGRRSRQKQIRPILRAK